MKICSIISNGKRILIVLSIILTLWVLYGVFDYLKKMYLPNFITEGPAQYIYIRTGATFDDVCKELGNANALFNRSSFEWLAEKKKYVNNIKPGRYKLTGRLSNKELLQLLRSGEQEPVKLTINNIRTINQLAGIVGHNLEADSAEIVSLLNNNDYLIGYYLNPNTSLSIFIPNTYEFYWNTNAKQFIKRMYKEFNIFWNEERRKQADSIGYTPIEVMIIASIVEEETNNADEYPIIAGLYINRLKINMPLQADPTIKFALGDFAIKRVLNKDTEVKSPYNTYRYKGLPPGPISMPSIKAIDGVLNYKRHKYLYFCAKSDFSGNHLFARTLQQHIQNANDYWKALDMKKIFE